MSPGPIRPLARKVEQVRVTGPDGAGLEGLPGGLVRRLGHRANPTLARVRRPGTRGDSPAHFERIHCEGIRTKLNTVVSIEGENGRTAGPLLVSPAQFTAFIERHAHLEADGLAPVAEDNQAMTGSYVMIDSVGRFFTNTSGRHTYTRPILDVGVDIAPSDGRLEPRALHRPRRDLRVVAAYRPRDAEDGERHGLQEE